MSLFSVVLPSSLSTMASQLEESSILQGTGAWTQFVHASSKSTTHAVEIPQALDITFLGDDTPVGTNADSGITDAPKSWEPVFDSDFWHGLNDIISIEDRPICHSSTQSGISSSANQTSLSSNFDPQSSESGLDPNSDALACGKSTSSRRPRRRDAK